VGRKAFLPPDPAITPKGAGQSLDLPAVLMRLRCAASLSLRRKMQNRPRQTEHSPVRRSGQWRQDRRAATFEFASDQRRGHSTDVARNPHCRQHTQARSR